MFRALRAAALALLLFAAIPAHAALRCTISNANTTTAASITLALSSCSGLVANDVIVLTFVIDKTSAAPTITGSTFSAITGAADMNVANPDGTASYGVRSRIADGTEGTITIATSGSHFYSVTARAYSGRSTSAPFAVTPAVTGPIAVGGGSPQALSITGLTANAADDLVLFVGGNQQLTTSDTYTLTPPSGYANTVNEQAAATQNGTQQSSSDKVNVTAGATGTLTGSLSSSAGASMAYGAYLISIAVSSGGGSCTNNFWSSAGAFSVPNGTTGSFWSTTGAFSTPNCSTGSFWLKSGAKGAT